MGALACDTFFQACLEEFASCRIQSCVRGWLVRRELRKERRAVACIQRTWRVVWPAQRGRAAAAKCIQRAFRVHRCRRAFLLLRSLIQALHQADPQLALRAVGQGAEASLADAAAGVRVRFRLQGHAGGAQPPALVFAVVTHKPIAQLGCPGVFGPQAVGLQPPQWRRVPPGLCRMAARLLGRAAGERRTSHTTIQRAVPMLHPPGVQQCLGAQGARQRRQQRLRALYEEGRQHEVGACPDAVEGGDLYEAANCVGSKAAEGKRQDSGGESEGEDGEDGELVLWSQGLSDLDPRLLDFEAYTAEWLRLGASAWSDEKSSYK